MGMTRKRMDEGKADVEFFFAQIRGGASLDEATRATDERVARRYLVRKLRREPTDAEVSAVVETM